MALDHSNKLRKDEKMTTNKNKLYDMKLMIVTTRYDNDILHEKKKIKNINTKQSDKKTH